MSHQILLGIDPGIADTGYGLVKIEPGKNPQCLAYGSIQTSLRLDLPTRLFELQQKLEAVIKKYKPSAAAIEQLFFNKNTKTALIVGQARGVALLTLKQNNLPIYEFTPGQVKQAVSCYGRADKCQVQRMVKMLLNLKELPRPDDAADALALALALSATNLWLKN